MLIVLGLLVVLLVGAALAFAIPKGRRTGGATQPTDVVEGRQPGRD